MKRGSFIVAALAAVLGCSTLSQAQDNPPPGGAGDRNNNDGGGGFRNRGGGGGGPGGNFDPAQMQQRMMERIKDQLGASDEEMQVIQPKLEKVMTDGRDVMAGRFGGRGRGGFGGRGPGGGGGGGGGFGGGPNGDAPQTELGKASQDLREALDNKDTPADTINQKLTALRDARSKAQTTLKSAQDDLKSVLTARQEAVLVSFGLLD